MNIYVGNLSYDTTGEELKEAFEGFGVVTSSSVIIDKITGRSKGFGFVEMADKSEAEAAISSMNGKELKGRTIRVNEAQPKPARTDRRGGGDYKGGNGGGSRDGRPPRRDFGSRDRF